MEILTLIFIAIIFIFSVVIHEVSHGAMASHLGDPTARLAGRLTLNPLKHLDPFGSVILPGILILMNAISGGAGFIFGWAKPVPFNPYNLRDQRYGRAKVAAAGPLSNLLTAVIFGFFLRFLNGAEGSYFQNIQLFFSYIVLVNLFFLVFNLWPGPPFDGHHILFTFFPNLQSKAGIFGNPLFSTFGAIFFMSMFGGVICVYLFKIITGFNLI